MMSSSSIGVYRKKLTGKCIPLILPNTCYIRIYLCLTLVALFAPVHVHGGDTEVTCPCLVGCFCYHDNMKLSVTCTDVILSVIPTFPRDTTSLFTQRTTINNIHQNAFTELPNLESMQLESNVVPRISTDAFHGLQKLKNLTLIVPYSKSMDDEIDLHLLKQLQLLTLKMKLTGIPSKVICSAMSVISLDLGRNHLTSARFGECFLNQTRRLETISLAYNRLGNITEDYFVNLRKVNVRDLNLAQCHITTIHPKAIRGLTFVEKLNLANNYLITLPDEVFSGNTKLQYLNLNDNRALKIPCDSIKNLVNLREIHCEAVKISIPKGDTLFCPAYRNLTSLRILNILFGKIKNLADDAFVNLEKSPIDSIRLTVTENVTPKAFTPLNNISKIEMTGTNMKGKQLSNALTGMNGSNLTELLVSIHFSRRRPI